MYFVRINNAFIVFNTETYLNFLFLRKKSDAST